MRIPLFSPRGTMAGITKGQNCRYSLFLHEAAEGADGRHYCRAMHTCIDDGYIYCEVCPLCVNDADRNAVSCWYYDITAGYSHSMPPEELHRRTDGLIMAGLTSEFPEYIAPDGDGTKRLVEERAIRYAADAHKGTYRKGSGLPYIVHPMEVMMICREMTRDVDVVAAAALHDVVEDTEHTLKDIEDVFGTRIAALVGLESENKREELPKEETWKLRKQENLERERTAPIEAKMIMLADKISNMRATVADYRARGRVIWDKFNMKDPAEQEWYYRSVADVLSELSDTPQYAEYMQMLDEVF